MKTAFALSASFLFAGFAHAQEPATDASAYGWLRELAGACWEGQDHAGRPTDVQCYQLQYGSVLRGTIEKDMGEGQPRFQGDSVLFWDAGQRSIEMIYWGASFHTSVTARFEGEALVFPMDGDGMSRSVWHRVDADRFTVDRQMRNAGDSSWHSMGMSSYRRRGN